MSRLAGSQLEEYRAAREGVVWRQLSQRGKLTVTGEDRISFLHAMLSSDVSSLEEWSGRQGTLLTATGKIVAEFFYYRLPDQVVIDVLRERLEPLKADLEAHIIMDDAVVEDRTGTWSHYAVDGPEAGNLLGGILGPGLPDSLMKLENRELNGATVWLVRRDPFGVPGFELILPAEARPLWQAALESAGSSFGLRQLGPEAFDVLRLEQGTPIFGADFTGKNNPLEARLDSAYSLTKGCYPGQEVVARATHIGGVARLLSRLVLEGAGVPVPGAAVLDSGDKEVGWITSSAFSPRFDRVIALAYLKRSKAEAGQVHRVRFEDGELRSAEVVEHFE